MSKSTEFEDSESEEEQNIFLKTEHKEFASTIPDSVDFSNVPDSTLPNVDLNVQLRHIMDCILPPRTFESEGQVWKQRASTVPCTRLDLVALEETFEQELKDRGAKKIGICPVRRDLYDQLFEELIRQVTVNCAERGLLLQRVRSEINLSFSAYQTVLESSIAYSLRKALTVENQQSKAMIERDEERTKNKELIMKISQIEMKLANDRRMNEEELKILEQRMRDENERLLESNKTLKNQLQMILRMEDVANPDANNTA